jgi:putative DNA primase/helicase
MDARDVTAVLGGVWNGSSGTCRCPAHDDQNPSLSIRDGDDGVLLKCFAGCSFDEICDAAGIDPKDLFFCKAEGTGGISTPKSRATAQHPPGLILENYAKAKALDVDFLKSCGLSTLDISGSKMVRMPYLDSDGQVLATRFRLSMDGPDRFRWKTGAKPCLYGLNRLAEAKQAGHVVIVEGESDCHTLWAHGIPAVGVPGANNWREVRDASRLDGIAKIYVVIEPDAGGEAMHKWLDQSAIRDKAHIIRLKEKDPSKLYLKQPDHFSAIWTLQEAMATPWKALYEKAVSEERADA